MLRKIFALTSIAVLAVIATGSASAAAVPDGVTYHHHRPGAGSPCEGLAGCTFVQLKGDPLKGPSEAMFTLKAGTPFSPHWHTSPEHVVGVSGTMLWHVKGKKKTYRVGAGDFLYYPSKAVHWGKCAPGADCTYYVFDEQPYDFHEATR
ncbi:cupin domain-containing protein [Nonomuraea sp. NBC_01738]|uniref:cupin domain-containing protein n=1 Tax=Nonomuraea sp. NBC_01738 TaxID=2976003 RepID=UPI002E1349BE|nr:cupin domain-containing protein [Nonomuraea sp. NBC_01738]